MENTSAVIGISDAMLAARTEARRIMDANKGDLVAEYKEIQTRLIASGLISSEEAEILVQLYKTGFEAGEGKRDAQKAFFESRDAYAKMAANIPVNPVALIIASAAVGSYQISEDANGTVIVAMARQSYSQAGAAIGAGIGAILGGAAGGVLGGEIGGLIGGIIDDKKNKPK
jgi:hypothetical protein